MVPFLSQRVSSSLHRELHLFATLELDVASRLNSLAPGLPGFFDAIGLCTVKEFVEAGEVRFPRRL